MGILSNSSVARERRAPGGWSEAHEKVIPSWASSIGAMNNSDEDGPGQGVPLLSVCTREKMWKQ